MNPAHVRDATVLLTCSMLVCIGAGCRPAEQVATSTSVKPATRPADTAADPGTSGHAFADGPVTRPAGAWVAPPGRVLLRVRAKGVQIYTAETGLDGQMKWTLVGPEAELRDETGRLVGKHYKGEAGPVWESSDGSEVVGKRRAERKSPHPDSIPELQLDAKAVPGAVGVLSKVTFVERLDTSGGSPPAATGSTAIGEEARSAYTAEYVFYGPRE